MATFFSKTSHVLSLSRLTLSVFLLPFFLLCSPGRPLAGELPVCVTCHKKIAEKKYLHPVIMKGGCIACHTHPHSAKHKAEKFLFAQGVELCLSCHDKTKFNNTVKHPPVAAGQCTLCHEVHSSDNPKLLKSAVPDLCFTCHDKAAFTDKTVHPPVAAGMCTACHNPHSTSAEKLLLAKLPDLCFTCHDKSMFMGKKGVHPPVAGGLCLSCHRPHASPNEKLLVKTPPELCFGCHDSKRFEGRKVEHAPVAAGLCLSCHAPHQSDSDKLLVQPIPALCFTCHEKDEFEYENIHPPVAEGLCMACHRPHSGSHKNLIRARSKNALCLKCHKKVAREAHAVGGIGNGHPLATKRVVRMGKKRIRLSCLSCHLPHSSEWPRLFRYEAERPLELCGHCHKGK